MTVSNGTPTRRGSRSNQPSDQAVYRPHLRTALVLTGTGTAGAYQAGVLRALQEAGVKIDLIAAHGIGTGVALLAAIDGGVRLWETDGVWRDSRVTSFYDWRPALRASFMVFALGFLTIVFPLAVIATGLLAYPFIFALQLISPEAGQRIAATYIGLVNRAFEPDMLPTLLPRLALLTILGILSIVAVAALREILKRGDRRRDEGPWWTWVISAPWSAHVAATLFCDALWRLLRGASPAKQPSNREMSRRYCDVLTENLGQPGFREIIICVHDLDARQDLIFSLLAEPFRRDGMRHRGAGNARPDGEIIDLAATGRNHVLDALAGAVSLPVLTEGHPMTFSIESHWCGETHRLSDRCGVVGRLLDEVAAAGARQAIVVSASAPRAQPHGLVARSLRFRARVGEYLAASGAAAVRDAVASHGGVFESLFEIAPRYNPVGPLDFAGTHDERSDRPYRLVELIDRGYDDAYRQFIDPIVGASGETVASKK